MKKVILITGSTDGIGKQTALELASQGEHVILHGRDREKGKTVREEIRNATGLGEVDFLCHDLSAQKNVRNLAEEIMKRYSRLDVLIHNAGVYEETRGLTPDGLETTFAVNHEASFLLTYFLLEFLKRSAPARILLVSSVAHRSARFDFDNLQGEKYYDGYQAYACSKYCNILFAYALGRRLEGTGVTVNALHPGVIDTKLLRKGFGGGGKSTVEGAQTLLFLATSPQVQGVSGRYFEEGKDTYSTPTTYDQSAQEKLWNVSEFCAESILLGWPS